MGPADAASESQLPTILFFGNDWAAENRTSSHQIASRLANRTRIVYFECPGLRPPSGSRRDLRKLGRKLLLGWRGVTSSEGFKVYTLLQLPFYRFAWAARLNRWFLYTFVRMVMRREKVDRCMTWFMVPHVAPLAGRLGEVRTVYYCIDDYSALPGVDEQSIAALDAELTAKADVVFVAAETLFASKSRQNGQTYLSPHGVDYEHFAKAHEPGELPRDVSTIPRPVIGFFGLIERWIDLDLVARLADARPEWSFVLIGRVAVTDAPIRNNIHYLGHRPYQALPLYGRSFDVAIIPYRSTRQVYHANPTKLREYLAMGKPVVAVSTPEILKFRDVVAIADSADEFLSNLEAVMKDEGPHGPARRMARAAEASWDARLDEVLRILTIEDVNK